MKVQSTVLVQAVGKGSASGNVAAGKREAEAERVVLSDTAQFIQSLRETVVDQPESREDLIAITRAELESGALGSEEDLDRAVDALLVEL